MKKAQATELQVLLHIGFKKILENPANFGRDFIEFERKLCYSKDDWAMGRREDAQMELRLRAADPAGNVTLLVETPVSPGTYRAAAERLLAFSSLGVSRWATLCRPGGAATSGLR